MLGSGIWLVHTQYVTSFEHQPCEGGTVFIVQNKKLTPNQLARATWNDRAGTGTQVFYLCHASETLHGLLDNTRAQPFWAQCAQACSRSLVALTMSGR
jgi:hypothetical protein